MECRLSIENGSIILTREPEDWMHGEKFSLFMCLAFAAVALFCGRWVEYRWCQILMYTLAALSFLIAVITACMYPGKSRRVMREGGIDIAVLSAGGVVVAEFARTSGDRRPWSDIAEVVLADSFKQEEKDNDNGVVILEQAGCALLMLNDAVIRKDGWLQRRRLNAPVCVSGERRKFVPLPYSQYNSIKFRRALMAILPPSIPVRHCSTVLFSQVAHSDTYTKCVACATGATGSGEQR
jgi:hypothetical protein